MAHKPLYDFPSGVVMTSQIERTRDELQNRVINQYRVGTRIGKGQHGDVFMGFDVTKNNMVVVRFSVNNNIGIS